MVFGMQKLQDELFCVKEERDYFQAKYLEQVSELGALRQELAKAKKEVVRLRQELMDAAIEKTSSTTTPHDDEDEVSTASCLTEDEEDEEEEKSEKTPEAELKVPAAFARSQSLYEEDVELRQSAEKLLQWASYRSSARTFYSSAAAGGTPVRLLDDEKKTTDDDDDDNSSLLDHPQVSEEEVHFVDESFESDLTSDTPLINRFEQAA